MNLECSMLLMFSLEIIRFPENLYRLYRFRSLLITLVKVEIKLRYRDSIFGILWTVLNPLINAVVLYFVFRAIFKMRSLDNMDFFPYVYLGILVLNFITRSIIEGSSQLHLNASILRKQNVPPEIFIVSKVLGNLLNFYLSIVPLLLYYLIKTYAINFNILLLPLISTVLTLLVSSISMFLSIFYLSYRDLEHLIPIFLNIVFYISPVFYTIDMIGGRTETIIKLNPIVYFLDALRFTFNIGGNSHLRFLLISLVIGMILFILALSYIKYNRKKAIFIS